LKLALVALASLARNDGGGATTRAELMKLTEFSNMRALETAIEQPESDGLLYAHLVNEISFRLRGASP